MLILMTLLMGCQPTFPPEPTSDVRQAGTLAGEATQATEFVDGVSNEELQNSLFDVDALHLIEITIPEGSYQSLNLEPEVWVAADLEWNGMLFEEVGIRIKGNGSFSPINVKPSLKVEFDKYGGPDAFWLDQIVLNNMTTDPSGIREVTAYYLYRAMGVPAVRATHTIVHINGSVRGVYTLMEDVQLRTFEPWGMSSNGWMAEMFLADFQTDLLPNFEDEDGTAQLDGIRGVIEALRLEDDDEAMDALEEHVEMDQFISFYAASGLIGQYDAYPYRSPGDDVHIYTDPDHHRISFIPHGLDETFRDPTRHMAIAPGLLANRCYFNPGCQDRLREQMWDTLDTMDALDLRNFTAEQSAKIAPSLHSDPVLSPILAELEFHRMTEFLENREDQLVLNMGARQP